MAVYESPITEFIGIMSHVARQYHGSEAIPLGAVEKMLALAKHSFGVDIPHLGTRITLRGDMCLCERESASAELAPRYIRDLKSRYFAYCSEAGPVIRSRNDTEEKLEEIIGKSYYSLFAATADSLVELWKVIDVRGLTLLDMYRKGDGGISFLIADLEYALDTIENWMAQQFKQGKAQTLNRFENALDAFRDKCKLLGCANEIFDKALKQCHNVQARAMIKRYRPNLPTAEYVRLLTELHDMIRKVGNSIIKGENAKTVVSGSLNHIRSWTRPRGEIARFASEETAAGEGFSKQVGHWLYALAGQAQSDGFRHHTLTVLGGERPTIAAADFKRFTETMSQEQQDSHTLGKVATHAWFSRIRTVTKNWLALFDGALSNTATEEGDSFFACFTDPRSAVYASAFAVHHLNLLEAAALPQRHLRYRLRIAIGNGTSAIIMDGVDVSAIANEMFHLLKPLQAQNDGVASTLMLHPTAAANNSDWLRYKVAGSHEQGWILDHDAILRDFVSGICATK